jgi:DNA-directed RNA polymerase subunit RPC12/RpoP
MKLLATDKAGNKLVVCDLCGHITKPTKPSHVDTYLKRACKACSHSQTLLKAKGKVPARLAKRFGVF